MTPRVQEGPQPWYMRPATLAVIVGIMALALNVVFW